MPVFTDSENFYSVMIPFFNKLKDDPNMGPKVLASGLIIQFEMGAGFHGPNALIIFEEWEKIQSGK